MPSFMLAFFYWPQKLNLENLFHKAGQLHIAFCVTWDTVPLAHSLWVESPIPFLLLKSCSTFVELLLLLLSRFSRVLLCATPQTAAHQARLSLGFSRQEHWSGLPFPSRMNEREKWKWSPSVESDSSWLHGL